MFTWLRSYHFQHPSTYIYLCRLTPQRKCDLVNRRQQETELSPVFAGNCRQGWKLRLIGELGKKMLLGATYAFNWENADQENSEILAAMLAILNFFLNNI